MYFSSSERRPNLGATARRRLDDASNSRPRLRGQWRVDMDSTGTSETAIRGIRSASRTRVVIGVLVPFVASLALGACAQRASGPVAVRTAGAVSPSWSASAARAQDDAWHFAYAVEKTTLQNIAPTYARLIGTKAPKGSMGRVMTEALVPTSNRPKVILTIVMDSGGRSLYETW